MGELIQVQRDLAGRVVGGTPDYWSIHKDFPMDTNAYGITVNIASNYGDLPELPIPVEYAELSRHKGNYKHVIEKNFRMWEDEYDGEWLYVDELAFVVNPQAFLHEFQKPGNTIVLGCGLVVVETTSDEKVRSSQYGKKHHVTNTYVRRYNDSVAITAQCHHWALMCSMHYTYDDTYTREEEYEADYSNWELKHTYGNGTREFKIHGSTYARGVKHTHVVPGDSGADGYHSPNGNLYVTIGDTKMVIPRGGHDPSPAPQPRNIPVIVTPRPVTGSSRG